MAVGDESIGFGGTAEVDDGPGDTFVAIPKIVNLGVPTATVGTVESKRLDLSGRLIKKLATLVNGGTLAIKQQFTHAGYARMEAIRTGFVAKNWKITVPDDDGDTEVTVSGILTANKTDSLEAEKITEFETMIEVSG